MKNIVMTQDILQDIMTYDKESGLCHHKKKDKKYYKNDARVTKAINSRTAGNLVGSIGGHGYIEVRIFNKLYVVHRLIWLHQTGEWPDTIDHINGIRSDNRWENLRSVTKQINNQNMPIKQSNTSGQTGVSYSERDKLWHSYINVNGKRKNLTWTKSKEEAIRLRKEAEIEFGFHPNHGREIVSDY